MLKRKTLRMKLYNVDNVPAPRDIAFKLCAASHSYDMEQKRKSVSTISPGKKYIILPLTLFSERKSTK